MTTTYVCGVIILMLAVVFLALWQLRQKPTWESVDDMMQYLAGEAVSMASELHGKELDFSEKSIMDVEEILGTIHEEYRSTRPTRGAKGLAMAYGAYIGEVIRRGTPGTKWEQDHPVLGEKSYPLHWLGGQAFPCGWCYGRIVNGPEDNVWHKYIMTKQP